MKQLLWLTLAAAVLVWGGALLDFGARPGARTPVAEDQPASVTPGAQSARARSGGAALAAQTVSPAAPESQGRSESRTSQRPAQSAAAPQSAAVPSRATVLGAAPQPPATAPRQREPEEPTGTGELGEGWLSPEFRELEETYIREPREGPWALDQERRLRMLLKDQPLGEQLVLAHCQQTLCRMVLQSNEPDIYERLLGVPGLTAETGLDAHSPFSLRSGQLVVYFRRAEER